MKVGQITTWLSNRGGGIPAVVLPLAANLERHGVSASIFGLVEKEQDLVPQARSLKIRTFRPVDRGLFGYSPKLTGCLLRERLDLVHQHGLWQYPSIACLRWYGKTAAPYLVSPHGMLDAWALGNSAWKKRLAGQLFQRSHLECAACLHALNMAELRAIRAFGLRNPVVVLPNGIDLPQECASVPPTWAAQVESGLKVLLYLGRLHPKKGLSALIRAWKVAAPEGWHLVIAGWAQGGYEAQLKRLAQTMGIARTAAFVGPQFGQDKAASFQRADAFVLPSLSEGLPMAALEAWSYRLPVLMTAACNLAEGFTAGAAMEMPLDPQGMSDKLTEFLEQSDEERQWMGNAGRHLVEERFTWERVAQQMSAVYQWIGRGGARPGVVEV